MRRREFITLLAGAGAWPFRVGAQPQRGLPVVGFLSPASPETYSERLRAFRQGLGEAGYVEGRNLAIEYRWAYDQFDRIPALATELIRLQPAAIVVSNTPTAAAVHAATTTIPTVFQIGGDPVAAKLVASLNRPGGNLTGVTTLNLELMSKRLELLHELIPSAQEIAVLFNSSNPPSTESLTELNTAANAIGVRLRTVQARTGRDLDDLFATLAGLHIAALLIVSDPLFTNRSERIAKQAFEYGVPTMYQYRDFAAAGGVMSYGSSIPDAYRIVGTYTGRI